MNYGKSGQVYRIEKLGEGFAYSNTPGTYLNSRMWRQVMVLVARSPEQAAIEGAYAVGSSLIRVTAAGDDNPDEPGYVML